uniref:Histone deacetylase (EC) n=1 Tax=Ganoderma boninense TaxID=34458 RepID=A0A5K1K6A0_9APHY|nr:Histone deacetylase (EC [Ganoderma boninense]
MATHSAVLDTHDLVPWVAFATNLAHFTSGPGLEGDEDWVPMRVVIAQLAHARWGFLAAEMDSTALPEYVIMIDELFWFQANELAGIVQVSRQSDTPNGGWMIYRFKFANAVDFADCVHAICEVKSQVLCHRIRMVDGLMDIFEAHFQQEAAREEVTRSSPFVTHGERSEHRDDVDAPIDMVNVVAADAQVISWALKGARRRLPKTSFWSPSPSGMSSPQHLESPSPPRSVAVHPVHNQSLLLDHMRSSPDSASRVDAPNRVEIVAPTQVERSRTSLRSIEVFGLIASVLRYAVVGTLAGSVTIVRYAVRIVINTFSLLTLPIAAFLAGLFVVSFFSFGAFALWRWAQTAMMSLDFCKVPMVCSPALASLSACNLPLIPAVIPYCSPLSVESIGRADFPGLLAIQHRAFDELVSGSTTNLELVVNVKHAELAVRDLVVLVKASNLTMKEPLADTLSLFSVDARRTGRGLQLLMSKIHGTVDRIIAYNTYALRVIDTAHKKSVVEGDARVDGAVLHAFQISMASFSTSISAIVVEATSVWADLDLLEERLVTIHGFCVQEALDTAFAQDELLWQLWTLLGGNRRQMRDLANRASVLQSVQQYRALASAYIAATVQALSVVDADLTELRGELIAQASAPDSIPVEVHIRSLERSLEQVRESSVGGKALDG